MNQLKRSIVPFLVIMVITFLLIDFGDRPMKYELVSYQDVPEDLKNSVLLDLGPGGGGLHQVNRYTYAFIGTEPDEKAIIEFVGDAHDGIGKEVRYSVSQSKPGEEATIIKGRFGDYAVHIVRIEKRISEPFGFFRVN
ncbi:hypothetical protein [Fredinandcohnia sp. 179-A 10B2 NHS]|uniref:hypothetical protein n=1 Tax=Fredinandcohnia sp. 179-A 10B2 NHS TaxID=3235176 RepID=UPI0039A27362